MTRFSRPLVLALFTATLLAFAGSASATGPRAQAAGNCSYGNTHGYGYTYLTSLWVYRVSCSTGRYVAKHHGNVRGWSCHSKTLDNSRFQYDKRVTCNHSGRRQVQWTYTQDK